MDVKSKSFFTSNPNNDLHMHALFSLHCARILEQET